MIYAFALVALRTRVRRAAMLHRQVRTSALPNDHPAVGKMTFDACGPVPNRRQIVSSPAPKVLSRYHHRCCNRKTTPQPLHPSLPLRSVAFDRRSPVCIPIFYQEKSNQALPAEWVLLPKQSLLGCSLIETPPFVIHSHFPCRSWLSAR